MYTGGKGKGMSSLGGLYGSRTHGGRARSSFVADGWWRRLLPWRMMGMNSRRGGSSLSGIGRLVDSTASSIALRPPQRAPAAGSTGSLSRGGSFGRRTASRDDLTQVLALATGSELV